jgi:amino acid transporter
MAEELQDASYRLPRVMLWATIINGGMMFVMAVAVTYCIGDLESGKQKPSIVSNDRLTPADDA